MANYEKVVYDEYAQTYDEGLKELLGGGDIEKFAKYKIQLIKYLCSVPCNGSILDFGCGTGRSLKYFREFFLEKEVSVFGCDISKESLKVAKKTVPDAKLFLNTTVEEFNSFEATYDVVMIACVLHHIDPNERQQWIKAIVKKLKPKGKIAVFEHNLLNPATKRIVKKPENRADDVNWMLRMPEIENLLLCEDSMNLVWKGYTLFSPLRPPFITYLERSLKWLPIGAQQCVIVEKNEISV